MKLRIASLTILCFVLAAVPVSAQVLYDNGPINGTTDAWTINFGYVVSESFYFTQDTSTGQVALGFWEFPGDTVTSLDWSITASENGGQVFGSGTASGANLTDQFISTNQYGYNIDKVAIYLKVIMTNNVVYWLNIQNAVVPSGDPVYWDENSGVGCGGNDGKGGGCPSQASESAVGTIPSEAFTIYGTSGGTTPEPGSIMLFGSGILGLAGVMRRKLF